jgi:hypothetical protein
MAAVAPGQRRLSKGVAVFIGGDEGTRMQYRFRVIVINQGSEAVTLANVGLRSTDRTININVENLVMQGLPAPQPKLPTRLEAHGALFWDFTGEYTKQLPAGVPFHGYTVRFKPLHRWSRKSKRTMYREHLSPFPEVKDS